MGKVTQYRGFTLVAIAAGSQAAGGWFCTFSVYDSGDVPIFRGRVETRHATEDLARQAGFQAAERWVNETLEGASISRKN